MDPYAPPRSDYGNFPVPAVDPGASASSLVSDVAVDLLSQTRPWAQLIGVLCLLTSLFLFVCSVAACIAVVVSNGTDKTPAGFLPALVIGLFYLPLAVTYVYPGIKLWGYASAISRLRATRTQADLEHALAQQKSFWKYAGIAALALLALYAVGVFFMLAVGLNGILNH